ncbi:hypothetical protein BST94_09075 [Nonlabens xylanidelens]|nr:hypothetical protein BST94_09075 [Nonlabens xylanidelens]
MFAMAKPIMPLFIYVYNQDYIAEFLCINKDKPEMACKGKCYLMQMYEKKNKEKGKHLPAIDMREYPIGFVEFVEFHPKTLTQPKKVVSFFYCFNYSYLYSTTTFHPPSVS